MQCEGLAIGGLWTLEERRLHINALKLLVGSFTTKSFARHMSNICICLRMDNISGVRYVNHLGGTCSSILARLTSNFWKFCLERNILAAAKYLPGLHNVEADWYSRHLAVTSNCKLDPSVFRQQVALWGLSKVDLFVFRMNAQLPQLFSWCPDPEAEVFNAFLQNWDSGVLYAFPPFMTVRAHLSMFTDTTPPWFLSRPSGELNPGYCSFSSCRETSSTFSPLDPHLP